MNKEYILKLADHINAVPDRQFDMTAFIPGVNTLFTDDSCGTACCLAGHTILLFDGNVLPCVPDNQYEAIEANEWVADRAQELLGLSDEQARDLFLGDESVSVIRRMMIGRHKAVRVLRHLALTGEVNWEI